jgi:2-C-methyl-D-erythritol 2,4-cyclodiphosphate synthase
MRVGIGYDVHPLLPDRSLVLGGISISHSHGLDGHSDGDVLVHAMIDSVLGAAGLGDIGQHFPPSEQNKGLSSLALLEKTVALLQSNNWRITGLDATIVAERPTLSPFIPEMRRIIAKIVQLEFLEVNIKATTTDGLGVTGRGEGIAAHAIATIMKQETM